MWSMGDASDDEDMQPGATAVNPIGLPLSQLKKLKTKFVDANGKMIKLTLDKFVEALSSNQPPAETQAQKDQLRSELCTLFKKIDASCTDAVDWEEFTEYMLLHMPGLNVGDGSCELSHNPQVSDAVTGAWGSAHTDMISSVAVVYETGATGGGGGGGRKYVTAGRDGFIKVWHPNLTVYKAIDVGPHRGRWLTACCWMQKSKRLAVASSNYRIFFYDSTFSATPTTYIEHKEGTPLCLGYRESTETDGREKEILMVGDNNGYVTVYPMDDDWTAHESKADNDWQPLPFKKKPIRRQYHDGWVTKVGFVSELQAMVTCGLDGEINLCDVHTNQRKEGRPAIRLHKKYGVHAWCWCRSYKFFASGGLDRQIIIWNPYTQMAMNYLQGHNAPILDVQVNETQHQLISMSVDKVIKVWDIQHYRCIQTFTDKTEYKPEDRLTCMAFDEELPGLVMCSSTINVLPMSVKVETSRTHVAPIVGALYNDVFHQVVSGDNLGTICVWDVRSGHLEFDFKRAHGEHKLTCMAFDVSKRRLYTGAEDGEVRLWNFSSGQQIKTYTMKQPAEINGLLWAQTALASPEGPNTFVVALALDRRVYVWPGSAKFTSGMAIEPKYVLEDIHGTGHTDDISCICGISTVGGLLATGGDDGCVVFWKVQETSLTSTSPIACRLSDGDGRVQKASERKPGGPQEPKAARRPRPGAGGRYFSSFAQEREAALATTAMLSAREGKADTGIGGLGGTSTGGLGKPSNRISCLPGQVAAGVDSPSAVPAGIVGGSDGRERLGDTWPEELGFEDEHAGMAAAGVEHMIFLEQKDCLLSTHADRRVRLWSRERAEFLQVLELVAPWGPEAAEKEVKSGSSLSSRAVAQKTPIALQTQGTATLVNAQIAPVTALYADKEQNQWLFTGDQDGCVRVWDLTHLHPPQTLRHLLRLHELQPHRLAITHLQHFELEGQVVVMSASADWTIALCTLRGERIGTFSGKGPQWCLADASSWCSSPPTLDDGPRPSEGDDGWSLSPRRTGKAGGAGRARANAGDARGAGSAGSVGLRTPRASQLRTRPVVAAQSHCGRGIFKSLNAVERFKPDPTIADHEKQYLEKKQKQFMAKQATRAEH